MKMIATGRPKEFFRWMRENLGIDTFVEGGTYMGETAAWAAGVFGRVITIELSPELYDIAKARHADKKNIEFVLGDTRQVLGRIVPQLTGPAVFWLDAHWSAGKTAGETNECPILAEIAILNASPYDHMILIDDARLFMAPPPPPHRLDQWPDIWTIERALNSGPSPRYTIITRDIIIAASEKRKARVADFWHHKRPERVPAEALARAFAEGVLPERMKSIIKRFV